MVAARPDRKAKPIASVLVIANAGVKNSLVGASRSAPDAGSDAGERSRSRNPVAGGSESSTRSSSMSAGSRGASPGSARWLSTPGVWDSPGGSAGCLVSSARRKRAQPVAMAPRRAWTGADGTVSGALAGVGEPNGGSEQLLDAADQRDLLGVTQSQRRESGLGVREQIDLSGQPRQQERVEPRRIGTSPVAHGPHEFLHERQPLAELSEELVFRVFRPEEQLRRRADRGPQGDHGEAPEPDVDAAVRAGSLGGQDEDGRDATQEPEVGGRRGVGEEDEERGDRSHQRDTEPREVGEDDVAQDADRGARHRSEQSQHTLPERRARVRLAHDEDRDERVGAVL